MKMGLFQTDNGGSRDAPVASRHSRTYAIISILCAISAVPLLMSIPGVMMGPLAVVFGFMAKSSGEVRLGIIGITSGATMTALGLGLMFWFMLYPTAPA